MKTSKGLEGNWYLVKGKHYLYCIASRCNGQVTISNTLLSTFWLEVLKRYYIQASSWNGFSKGYSALTTLAWEVQCFFINLSLKVHVFWNSLQTLACSLVNICLDHITLQNQRSLMTKENWNSLRFVTICCCLVS